MTTLEERVRRKLSAEIPSIHMASAEGEHVGNSAVKRIYEILLPLIEQEKKESYEEGMANALEDKISKLKSEILELKSRRDSPRGY